jgi:hypothetical protein
MNGTAWFNGSNVKFKILFFTITGLAIGAIIYYVFLGLDTPSVKEVILKDALPMEFQGRIDSVYYDKMNHNTKTVILSDGYKYELYRDWEPMIDLGDSLNKKKGSFKVDVFKMNGKKVILDYKILVKTFK